MLTFTYPIKCIQEYLVETKFVGYKVYTLVFESDDITHKCYFNTHIN